MADPVKALVVKLSSLGDLFHALPAVHALKTTLNCSIDWVTQPDYAALVGCFDDVDNVLTYPRRSFFRSFPAWHRALRAQHYDYVFDFQGLFKSGLTGFLAHANRRIGPSYARECASIFYHEQVGTLDKNRHAVEEALDFARHFNIQDAPTVFPVTFPQKLIDDSSKPHIAYLPCSRWETKNWPAQHVAGCITRIHEQVGGTPYLLGGPEDRAICDTIATMTSVPVKNLCGSTSLVELGSLLQNMDLLVTVDSGPMHMAAAIGIPVLAVFGATDPKRTGPFGEQHRVVQRDNLPCIPCRSRVCQRAEKDQACLTQLPPDQVAETALQMLALN